ncbi:MAG: UDP-N-acetyl-D-glucosamine dehydrogenase, partial [Candidatus Schekmanbacteria bacterium RBG_16_38_10]
MQLKEKFLKRKAKLGVIGLGYVGLPLCLEMANAGFDVTGIDIDEEKVKKINKGISYIIDVKNKSLSQIVKKRKLIATADFEILKELDAVSICVPTPLRKTKDPDISFIISAVEEVKKYLRTGQLIVLESTTYPGTTNEIILSELEKTGLKVGKDFYLAFSPERVDPGNRFYNTKNTPKIVGGVTKQCTKIAKLLYEQFVDTVIPVSSTQSAEMVKLVENTFRSINIGMVNEMALMCNKLNIDVWEIIDAAATKPFGFMAFYPGPGLGGHCIPVDPHYLAWKLRTLNYNARFIELAGEINSYMPHFIVEKIIDGLNRIKKSAKGSKILILGVAYKKN